MEPELPPLFVARMEATLRSDLPSFLQALTHPEEGLRVNTLRLTPSRFEQIAPPDFGLIHLPFAPEAFAVRKDSGAGKHPYHAAGLYYLQDPGAMIVGALTDPQPGEHILDLSAAPGGKATHLATRMKGSGLLVANDINPSRAQELARNLERSGVRNALVTAETPERLADHFGAHFDRVLVDAPCSGESMFHKSRSARSDWSPEAVVGCAKRQRDLLRVAARLVAPGGRLVYSTCTFSREENEEVIERFLEDSGEFEPASLPPLEGAEEVVIGRGEAGAPPAAYRLWPHRLPGAGHFVAVLRRRNGGETGRSAPPAEGPDREGFRRFAEFAEDVFPKERFDPDRLAVQGPHLYLRPEGTAGTRGLRVLRSGLWLGTLERNRFEPSHALALAAPAIASPKALELDLGDPRVERYFAGHPIEAEGPGGWFPLAVGDYYVGWGKRVGTTVKNHYPKGLRRPG